MQRTNIARPSVLVVESDPEALAYCVRILSAAGLIVKAVADGTTALDALYDDPPQCIVCPFNVTGPEGARLFMQLKADKIYGHLPLILLLTLDEFGAPVDWKAVIADDYLIKPFGEIELVSRVRLGLARAERDINANPLSGLPGNIPIMREAEARIVSDKPFALAYADINDFKAFNDVYGFARGDEVLRMTARILAHSVRDLRLPDIYLGHAGGDDFVFITPPEIMPQVCQVVLSQFDGMVPNFYDNDDRQRGWIQTIDRQGNLRRFPLMTMSIAVVNTQTVRVEHIGDLNTRAAQLKHVTKRMPGSNFLVDRRK